MKTLTKTILLSTVVLMSLSACAPQENKKDDKVTISATAKSSAEELADAAEQLVSPYTFMLADKVVDMALEKDPSNLKAQFYKAFLKQMMSFKGIAKRIRPYVAKQPGGTNQLDKNVKNFPESPLKKFLLDGKEDIQTIGEMQNVLAEYTHAVNDFRLFLKNNNEMDLILNLNPYVFEQRIKDEAAKDCKIISNTPENVSVECDYKDAARVKVNSADALVLSQTQAGMVAFLSLYNSYSLNGIEGIVKTTDGEDTRTSQEIFTQIEKTPGLGKLRTDATIGLLHGLGADFSVAMKWAMKYQDRLCPRGANFENRKGFLFNKGICIENMTKAQSDLALLDQALQGAIGVKISEESNENVNVDYFALSKNPVQDLKSLLPNQFNHCGKAVSLKDKSMGGVFVDGNAEQYILTDKSCE